ncbi:LpqB family beta-propeller domain-containing protein [Cellulomonas endophytica]|uniref:LpqB family beta-propeller domain-containing protein n=1 Tax=Cellulomonas endophytica TaxID=2494735 RepID=UPI001011DC3A|nr:LpqB family beta-propeller domain-containing protein [Cellulomonas endophytica]
MSRARAAAARPRRRGVLALVVALALGLAGCVSVPTRGPVVEGDAQVEDAGGIDVLAEGPREDAQPVDIVQGFLLAGAAGFSDDFVVAREYLSGDARAGWSPLEGIVVAGAVDLRQTSDTEVTAAVPVVALVDGDGRYTEAARGAAQTVTFGLVQGSSGQWRISSAPDGLILTRAVFASQYRAAPVYFLSPDETLLVPETRWFPTRNLETAVVQALLAGPSPWLRDAVTTAVPEGVRLAPGAVTVDEAGVAAVGLEPSAAVLASDRALLLAQLEATLELPRVGAVRVTTGGSTGGVLLEGAADVTTGTTRGVLEVLDRDGGLLELAGGRLAPVADLGPLPAGLRAPARSEDGLLRVGLSPQGMVTVPAAEGTSRVLLARGDLVAPSVDRAGWAWTASGGEGGGVWVAADDGTVVEVTVGWLADRRVRALRLARDGARVAVVSEGADGVAVDVAGVLRDAEGAPQGLGEARRVGAALQDASDVTWVDATTLAVVGRTAAAAAVHLVPLAGETVAQPELAGLVDVAAGRGERSLVVTTTDGELYRLDGPSWVRVGDESGLHDPAYPG